jgi:uncharacterized protein (DUF433 family)
MKRKVLGRFIVLDPRVCHGQAVFKGTRVLVADVLELVASGMAWEAIADEFDGRIRPAAIAEAVRLARDAFVDLDADQPKRAAGS